MRFLAFLYIYTVDYNIPNNLTWNSITEHKYQKYIKSTRIWFTSYNAVQFLPIFVFM